LTTLVPRIDDVFEAFRSLSLAVTTRCKSNSITSTGVNVIPINISECAAIIPSLKSRWKELLICGEATVELGSVGFRETYV
jgi:hypothetical protein